MSSPTDRRHDLDALRLRVHGYLGIRLLGRTTTWLRVGTENQCRKGV